SSGRPPQRGRDQRTAGRHPRSKRFTTSVSSTDATMEEVIMVMHPAPPSGRTWNEPHCAIIELPCAKRTCSSLPGAARTEPSLGSIGTKEGSRGCRQRGSVKVSEIHVIEKGDSWEVWKEGDSMPLGTY